MKQRNRRIKQTKRYFRYLDALPVQEGSLKYLRAQGNYVDWYYDRIRHLGWLRIVRVVKKMGRVPSVRAYNAALYYGVLKPQLDKLADELFNASDIRGVLNNPDVKLVWEERQPCPRDTNGDGDCGARYCPHCGQGSDAP